MKRAFTLIELLVVIGIMGLLGTVSVGGYRAMQRGMEDRGVLQNVNSMLRAAYQRAQIDRQPTIVYYWNETLRSDSGEDTGVVVGKAVAVRRYGRLSDVRNGLLIDEFADLNLTYPVRKTGGGSTANAFYLYPMDNPSTSLKRSLVAGTVVDDAESPQFYTGTRTDRTSNQKIPGYGFSVEGGFSAWQAGMSYGMEFISIELPHNYIFGSRFSSSAEDPISGIGVIVYDVKMLNGGNARNMRSNADDVEICALRLSGGALRAKSIGRTQDPGEKVN